MLTEYVGILVFDERNRQRAEGIWSEGKPKKWYYAIPMLLLWGLIIMLIIMAVK